MKKWEKCKADILDYIERKKLGENSELPSDKEFAELFDCSLQPVIKAMQELAAEKIVIRTPGRNTTVGHYSLDDGKSFSASARRLGYDIENELLELSVRVLDPTVSEEMQASEFFGINPNVKVVIIKRKRIEVNRENSLDKKPASLQTVFLNPGYIGMDKIQLFDLTKISLIQIYELLGFHSFMRLTNLKAVHLNQKESGLLGIESNEPVLENNQQMKAIYNKSVIPLEYMRAVYKPGLEFTIKR